MSEFSEQLKARADLGQLIGEVVALKPGGNGFIGLCPFHQEKTPSFHVHKAKRFYYCFGCHAHGDIFQFYMQLRKLSFPEAVALVAERLGVPMPRASGQAPDPLRQELLRVHAAACEYFEAMLAGREGGGARAYLESRAFPAAPVAPFRLGFAPEHGHGLARHLEQQGFAPTLALRAGLCQVRREGSAEARDTEAAQWSEVYDRFRNRLMFPIRDERGQVIAFGGRALEAGERTPKYLNSPEHPLYTKGRVLYNLDRAREAIRELGYTILVEGYFDCLRVDLAGFHNVVASCGTALTPAQVGRLGQLSHKICVNFDPDPAGRAAAERSVAVLLEEGFQMRVVELEGGMDPDLFVRGKGAEAYAQALKTSRSFFDYLGTRAREQFDLRRPEGKSGAINFFLPFLSHVQDPILRQSLAENLAQQLGIDQPLVSRQLVQAAKLRRREVDRVEATTAMLYAERVILRAWIEWEARREEIERTVREGGLLEGLGTEALLEQLRATRAGADWPTLLAALDEEGRRQLAEIALEGGGEGSADPVLDEEQLRAALDSLRERRARNGQRSLREQIATAAAEGDREALHRLLRQKAQEDARARGRES